MDEPPPTTPPPTTPPPPTPPPTGWEAPAAAQPPPPTTWEAPPEEVGPAPGYAYGGFGERLIAYVVDVLIGGAVIVGILVVMSFLVAAGAAANSPGLGFGGGLLGVLALLVVGIGYFPWFWARGGQTPGMRMFNLRVVRDRDGGPLSGGQAFLRLIGYWINSLVLYLGFVWIFIDKRKRGWHDLIAGTVVIKKL